MRQRLISSFVLLGSLVFVVVGGCGGDDESSGTKTGGTGGSAGSAGSGGSSGSGTSGSSTAGNTSTGGTMGSPEPTGSTCQMPSDCYAGLDTSELAGDVACIDKVEDGYCTHECETDDDCCAVEGECKTGFKQVCASFENSDVKYCFLSCEEEDLVPAAGGMTGAGGAIAVDANEYCEREAHPRFLCRSTGGGAENRRACLPDGGLGGAPGMGGAPNEPMGGAGGVDPGAGGMSLGGIGAGGDATPAGGQTAGGAPNAGAGGAP